MAKKISASTLCFALALVLLPGDATAQCGMFEQECGGRCISFVSSCCGGRECDVASSCFGGSVCCPAGSPGLCGGGKCLAPGASCCGGAECSAASECFDDRVCCPAGTEAVDGECVSACDGAFNDCGAGKVCGSARVRGESASISCNVSGGRCLSGCVEKAKTSGAHHGAESAGASGAGDARPGPAEEAECDIGQETQVECGAFQHSCGGACISFTSSCCCGKECAAGSSCFGGAVCCPAGSPGLCGGRCLAPGASCCGGSECAAGNQCFGGSTCCPAGTTLLDGECVSLCDGALNDCGDGNTCGELQIRGGAVSASCSIVNGKCASGCSKGSARQPASTFTARAPPKCGFMEIPCGDACISSFSTCCGGAECDMNSQCFNDSLCCPFLTEEYDGKCVNSCDGVLNDCGAGMMCGTQKGGSFQCSVNEGKCESGCTVSAGLVSLSDF